MRASVSLLAALAQDALLEGWLSLAAGLLFRLLEISRPLTVRTRLTITFLSPFHPAAIQSMIHTLRCACSRFLATLHQQHAESFR